MTNPTNKAAPDSAVSAAAEWLAERHHQRWPQPIIPELRKLFGLSPKQACAAIQKANARSRI